MSIVITTDSKQAWEKAIDKARTVKPRVSILGFGEFKVCGSKGDCYQVTWRHANGELKVECDCPAGRKGRACYHCPPTGPIYKLQVRERAEKARLAANFAATICENCGGLQGGPEADEDHRTCVCTQQHKNCRCCERPVVSNEERPTCQRCTKAIADPFYFPLAGPATKTLKSCADCGDEWPAKDLSETGLCPDCLIWGNAA